jgi:hypothetical protein
MTQIIEKVGAGEGNRTLVISLEGCCSTIELHPRARSLHASPPSAEVRRAPSRSAVSPAAVPRARRLVGEVGLEPTKAKPADLQSAPFAARDTPPNLASARMRGSSRVMGSGSGGVNRATSACASAENAADVLILTPPHGTLAA